MHKLCFDVDVKWPSRLTRLKSKKKEDASSKPPRSDAADLVIQDIEEFEEPLESTSCMMPVHDVGYGDTFFNTSKIPMLETSQDILKDLSTVGILPSENAEPSDGKCWDLIDLETCIQKLPTRLAAINIEADPLENLKTKQRMEEKRRLSEKEEMNRILVTANGLKVRESTYKCLIKIY